MATHPVFLPEESHGQRSLVSYCPSGQKESKIAAVSQHTHTQSEARNCTFNKFLDDANVNEKLTLAMVTCHLPL